MLPELKTERLHLRELRPADGPRLHAFQSLEAQWQHQAVEPAEFADSTYRIRQYLKHRGPHDRRRLLVFAAIRNDNGEMIGQVSLSRSAPRVASLGFGVAEMHWSRGYASEMAARLVTFGFGYCRLHRIEADVSITNIPCIRFLEKIGMTREGVARDCIWAQGKWWTEAKYAMLEDDRPVGTTRPVPATAARMVQAP